MIAHLETTFTDPTEVADPALERVERAWWEDFLHAAGDHGHPPARIAGAVAGRFPGSDVLALNRAVGLGIDEPADSEHLAALIRFYRTAGVGRFFLPLAPGARPAGLAGALERRGLRRHNRWAKLVREGGDVPAAETDLRIEEVGPEHAGACARLFAPAVDWPPAAARLLAALVGRTGWHHYLAFDGDRPAATAALFLHGDHAALTFAATHPRYRRRGAQSALLARRIRDAGARRLVVETAQDRPERPCASYRNVRRAGFRLAYLRPNFIWERSA